MLEAAGLAFEVAPADVDEAAVKDGLVRSGLLPPFIAEAQDELLFHKVLRLAYDQDNAQFVCHPP